MQGRAYAFVISALALLVLDQVSKYMAFQGLSGEGESLSFLEGALTLRRHLNDGAFLGILQGQTLWLIAANILCAGLFVYLFFYFRTDLTQGALALGLLFGGTLSNFADRLLFDGVRDFIEATLKWPPDFLRNFGLHLGGPAAFFTMPGFNIADLGATLGVLLCLIALFRKKRHRRHH